MKRNAPPDAQDNKPKVIRLGANNRALATSKPPVAKSVQQAQSKPATRKSKTPVPTYTQGVQWAGNEATVGDKDRPTVEMFADHTKEMDDLVRLGLIELDASIDDLDSDDNKQAFIDLLKNAKCCLNTALARAGLSSVDLELAMNNDLRFAAEVNQTIELSITTAWRALYQRAVSNKQPVIHKGEVCLARDSKGQLMRDPRTGAALPLLQDHSDPRLLVFLLNAHSGAAMQNPPFQTAMGSELEAAIKQAASVQVSFVEAKQTAKPGESLGKQKQNS